MAQSVGVEAGGPDQAARWGAWRGVECAEDGCTEPAKCKGWCASHYNKHRWADGVRPPSVNPESRRLARIKHRYGITGEEFAERVAQQGGVCAVCGLPPDQSNTRAHWGGKLCVDHNHETGAVRGLLCNDCNLVVGYGKTAATLRAAADYLDRHS